MIIFVVMILVPIGAQLMVNSFRESKIQQKSIAEAENVARAGLQDAISWFKRQSRQPVCSGAPPSYQPWEDGAFDPKYSTSTYLSDTKDESIGLVKEDQLTGSLWYRYEVKRQTNPAIAPYDPHAVHDITAERLHSGEQKGDGLVWYIESTGYVFRRKDLDKKFNEPPNELLGKSIVSTEIRRLNLNLPACACITYDMGSGSIYNVVINENGIIDGQKQYGIGYSIGSNSAKLNGVSPKTGKIATPNQYLGGLSNPTVLFILGVSSTELKNMADYSVTSVNALPAKLKDMSLVYIDGNADFNSSHQLSGSGIVFVNGNMTVAANSNCLYRGLVYVAGTATINEPATISGCLVAYKGLTLSRANALDIASIEYDLASITNIRQQVCLYRENKSVSRMYAGASGQ